MAIWSGTRIAALGWCTREIGLERPNTSTVDIPYARYFTLLALTADASLNKSVKDCTTHRLY
jgi:hypothetical protein